MPRFCVMPLPVSKWVLAGCAIWTLVATVRSPRVRNTRLCGVAMTKPWATGPLRCAPIVSSALSGRTNAPGAASAAAYDRPMPDPPTTDDGRYVVIAGRRWRATDPSIPDDRRSELVRILMAWRREVRRTRGTARESEARAGVHAAKVALGERGTPPWWEETDSERRARWQAHVPEPT